MAKFKFRLEKVLDLRKKKEEERERELAELKKLLAKEEQFLQQLQRESTALRRKIARLQDENDRSLDIEELLRHSDYLEHLRDKILSQIETVKQVISDVENKRQELVEASKEKKVIEKLKEQQYKRFRTAVEEWEQRTLDEIGTSNYSHRRDT